MRAQREDAGLRAFVSEETGPDGRFEIWAEREGTFYLGARQSVGTAREKEETLGLFTGSPDHSLVIRFDGREVTGLDVVVTEGGAGE